MKSPQKSHYKIPPLMHGGQRFLPHMPYYHFGHISHNSYISITCPISHISHISHLSNIREGFQKTKWNFPWKWLRGTFPFTALIRNRIQFWILTHFVNFSPSLPLLNKKQQSPLIMIPPTLMLDYLSIEFTADSQCAPWKLQPFPVRPISFTVCSCVVRGCVSQVTLVTGL